MIIVIIILTQNAINTLQRHTSSLISQTTTVLQLLHIFSTGISVKPHHYDTKTVLGMYTSVETSVFTQHLSMPQF